MREIQQTTLAEFYKQKKRFIVQTIAPFMLHALISLLSLFVNQYFSAFELIILVYISDILKEIFQNVIEKIAALSLLYFFFGVVFYIFIIMQDIIGANFFDCQDVIPCLL
jgi:hypothetical protein